MKRLQKRLSIFSVLLMTVAGTQGQDVHFAQVQDMKIWYNPSLKTDKESLARANFRSVKYQYITSYSSKAATIELPFINKEKDEQDNIGYFNLAAGINAESSDDQSMEVSAGMLALSYALPLNNDNTYLAAGLQGAYTFSRITSVNYIHFPDKFDQYGPIGSALLVDPYQTGNQYQYFTLGLGASLFHSGEKRQWYIGGSVRHVNQPFTNRSQPDFRLSINRGIQAGYTTALSDEDVIGGYASFTWQGGVHEDFVGGSYTRNLGDSANSALFLGVGYRIGDAVLPDIGFRTGVHRFAFCYEFNLFTSSSKDYNRKAFEFSYRINL